jgi:hypothetical protein
LATGQARQRQWGVLKTPGADTHGVQVWLLTGEGETVWRRVSSQLGFTLYCVLLNSHPLGVSGCGRFRLATEDKNVQALLGSDFVPFFR